ncbi:hypothetical protein BaRGS_00029338 [Batillaria attramentaria]|uniref:Uncharacterized protein n=1 Tax=Batillaria attramentaria TaxID=370345 RepID=A0ABD0JWJ5_9CAEN
MQPAVKRMRGMVPLSPCSKFKRQRGLWGSEQVYGGWGLNWWLMVGMNTNVMHEVQGVGIQCGLIALDCLAQCDGPLSEHCRPLARVAVMDSELRMALPCL